MNERLADFDPSETGMLFEVGPPLMPRKKTRPDIVYGLDWESELLPPTGEKLDVDIDHEKVHTVLSTLLQAFREKTEPYNLDSVRLPQDPRHMPENLPYGGVQHAMFLWNLCYYMRGGIKSVDATKRLSKIYEDMPELFDCETAARMEPAQIQEILTQYRLGMQERVSKEWVENSRLMLERWDGDPRKMFVGVDSYDEALARIKNDERGGGFKGFKEKMTSMITYYLMDEDLIEPFIFPIPVDLHVMRVSIEHEMIKFPNAPHGTNLYTEETLSTLRKLYYDYAVEHGVSPLRLCDAVWLLSESLCGKHPGNVTLEPEGRKNRKGRATVLVPLPVDPTSPAQQRAYEASCRICPVENTCEFNVPGKPNYVWGAVYIRGKRFEFPMPPPPAPRAVQEALF